MLCKDTGTVKYPSFCAASCKQKRDRFSPSRQGDRRDLPASAPASKLALSAGQRASRQDRWPSALPAQHPHGVLHPLVRTEQTFSPFVTKSLCSYRCTLTLQAPFTPPSDMHRPFGLKANFVTLNSYISQKSQRALGGLSFSFLFFLIPSIVITSRFEALQTDVTAHASS